MPEFTPLEGRQRWLLVWGPWLDEALAELEHLTAEPRILELVQGLRGMPGMVPEETLFSRENEQGAV